LKQSVQIIISFLSILILCSIGYQPIIAENKIEHELLLIAEKSVVEYDCDCEKTIKWPFPFICLYLNLLFTLQVILATKLHKYTWLMKADETWEMARTFNCRWTNPFIDVI